MKQFGVGLRITIKEEGNKNITKADIRRIIDHALQNESQKDAELVLTGEIDGIKRLKQ